MTERESLVALAAMAVALRESANAMLHVVDLALKKTDEPEDADKIVLPPVFGRSSEQPG
jgi:hypothetical protein